MVPGLVPLQLLFQFTPPHRGHLQHNAARFCFIHVSIHAPAQGASEEALGIMPQYDVSIHAPAQGASSANFPPAVGCRFQFTPPHRGHRLMFCWILFQQKFQFTPPHRGHLSDKAAQERLYRVSIHAPAQGASPPPSPHARPIPSFNSRPRTGGIIIRIILCSNIHSFNSRPRTGGIGHAPLSFSGKSVSIHAPAQGASAF